MFAFLVHNINSTTKQCVIYHAHLVKGHKQNSDYARTCFFCLELVSVIFPRTHFHGTLMFVVVLKLSLLPGRLRHILGKRAVGSRLSACTDDTQHHAQLALQLA